MKKKKRELRILQVDDEQDEILLLQRAFRLANLSSRLLSVEGGNEAMDYLDGKGSFRDRTRFPLPDVILLDLKMPMVNGFDTLYWLKNVSRHRLLPVTIWSSSSYLSDVIKAYELGASSYMAKPGSMDDLVAQSKIFAQFWERAFTSDDRGM